MTTKRYTPDELRGAASFSPGNQTIAAMLRQAAEDCEDAQRYRWLRDPNSSVGLVIDKLTGEMPYDEGTRTGGYGIYEYRAGQELDEAIDRARTQEQAK